MERRFLFNGGAVGLARQEGEESQRIVGYGAVFYDGSAGTEFTFLGIHERIMPGAFDRALREDDVRGLFNHNPDNVLARTGAGTLALAVDAKGLRYEIAPPATRLASDLLAVLARGDVTGSSFSFEVLNQQWREEGDEVIREIQDVKLWDVGPVTFPAYSATTSGIKATTVSQSDAMVSGRAWPELAEAVLARDAWRRRERLAAYQRRASEVIGSRVPARAQAASRPAALRPPPASSC